jgi:anti-anti-sigma regulatory factor
LLSGVGEVAMLKIETAQPIEGTKVLRLEGQLIGPWVDELRRTCDALSHDRLLLDLAGVSFVDRRGLDLLQSLCGRRVQLRHCSAFVREQLRAASA